MGHISYWGPFLTSDITVRVDSILSVCVFVVYIYFAIITNSWNEDKNMKLSSKKGINKQKKL